MGKTWKEKVGKRLMKHVKDTTTGCTLREVKFNVEAQLARAQPDVCFDCQKIARKLGLEKEWGLA